MIKINENFSKLQASYLFSDIAKRVSAFQAAIRQCSYVVPERLRALLAAAAPMAT